VIKINIDISPSALIKSILLVYLALKAKDSERLPVLVNSIISSLSERSTPVVDEELGQRP